MRCILVVCTGNTCRSPMAEALLEELVIKNGLDNKIKIISAGLYAGGVGEASRGARLAMAKRGLSLEKHRSRQLLPEYVQAADLVLAMTNSHKAALINMMPQAIKKIFTLAEYAGVTSDISDPFGGDEEVYEECAADIALLVSLAWPKIADLAENN